MVKHMKKSLLIVASLMAAVWVTPALAAGDVELKLSALEEITVVDKQGKKVVKHVKPDHIEPGDVVFYSITYHNKGKKAVEHIVINDPIPENTVYIAGSARGEGAEITFSVDGKHFAPADKLMVKGEDGKMRPARSDEYHHVRWRLTASLGAGEQGSVSFKARVK